MDNVIVNGVACKLDQSDVTLIVEHSNNLKPKGRHKRESKNTKQMRNTKQNRFSHSSASPRNDKQCSAKRCFANQTNRCLAGFASRSDLFRDNAWLTKHRRKVNQRHLIFPSHVQNHVT